MSLAENIKHLRQMKRVERSMTQADLAEATGLNPCAISHFETGNRTPSLKNLIKLSDALGVTIDDLVRGNFHD